MDFKLIMDGRYVGVNDMFNIQKLKDYGSYNRIYEYAFHKNINLAALHKDISELFLVKQVVENHNDQQANILYIRDGSCLVIQANLEFGGPLEDEDEEGAYIVHFYSTDKEFYEKVKGILKSNIGSSVKNDSIYAITSSGSRLTVSMLGKVGKELERDNYTSQIINQYDAMCAGLNSKDPSGRLIVLDGPPGTGKTHMVRGLLTQLKNSLPLLLQSSLFADISSPGLLDLFMREKEKDKSIVLIVEDGDALMVPRQADNISAISTLLNAADGILGHALDLRIVVTTNAQKMEMDDALLRPGRLLDIIHIGKLDKEHANRLVKERSEIKTNAFNNEATLAEVYAAINGKIKFEKKKENTLGFGR